MLCNILQEALSFVFFLYLGLGLEHTQDDRILVSFVEEGSPAKKSGNNLLDLAFYTVI